MQPFFAALVGLALITNPAHSADYTITKIADTANGEFTELSVPTINNDGVVAFMGADGAFIEGVYSASPIAVIADATDVRFASLTDPSISNNEFVAFGAYETGGLDNGIYRSVVGDNNPATLLYDTSGQFSCVLNPSVNSSGAVAFRGESAFNCESFLNVSAGIYVGTGGAPTLIADNAGDFSDVGFAPKINDNGTVVFTAELDSGDSGVYTGNGGALTTIVESGGKYFSLLGSSINCAGTVAVVAVPSTGGGSTIIKGDGGAITTIVSPSSGLSDFRQPSINCGETVAFIARAPNFGLDGLYMASNGDINKVIQVGDTLEGLTVAIITFSSAGLNDKNRVVFRAKLSDDAKPSDDKDYIFIADQIDTSGPVTSVILNFLLDDDDKEESNNAN